jgi:hypothetical protein
MEKQNYVQLTASQSGVASTLLGLRAYEHVGAPTHFGSPVFAKTSSTRTLSASFSAILDRERAPSLAREKKEGFL